MKILKITFLFLIATVFSYAQTVHTVDNRDQSGALFTSVQEAIDVAVAGDIIQIHPSETSYGNVTVPKTLTLVGLGHNPANANGVTATLGNITLNGNCPNTEIKGLTSSNVLSGNSGNSTNLNSIHIINNRIIGAVVGSSTAGLGDNWIVEGNYFSGSGTNVQSGTNSNNWEISNNFMRGATSNVNNTCIITNNIMLSSSNNFNFFSNCDNPLVNNNMFIASGGLTEIGLVNSTITFVNNLTYSFGGLTIDALSGSGNLDNTNPMFVNVPIGDEDNFYNNDYNLVAGSLAINAGSDGTDIGLTGNNFVFDTNGRPNLMPYPTNITITNSVVAPGQTLNVEFSAEQKQ